MRTFLLISLLLLAGTTFAEGDRQQSKARAELDKAQAEYLAALLDADVAALARIWTEDYTFINGRGMLLSKDDRLKNIETGATELDSIKESGRQVRLYDDDTAVLTGTVTLEAKYSGQAASGDYGYTIVWIKRDGRWQMAATQITPIAE